MHSAIIPSAVAGVWTLPLAVIPTHGGPVLHMLRRDSPFFTAFGEMYFSVVEPGAVKAWKRHTEQTQLFAVPSGLMKIVVYDAGQGSPSCGQTAEFILGRPDRYQLLCIPPLVWYGFCALGDHEAVLANCTDIPHRRDEAERLPCDAPGMPSVFGWGCS